MHIHMNKEINAHVRTYVRTYVLYVRTYHRSICAIDSGVACACFEPLEISAMDSKTCLPTAYGFRLKRGCMFVCLHVSYVRTYMHVRTYVCMYVLLVQLILHMSAGSSSSDLRVIKTQDMFSYVIRTLSSESTKMATTWEKALRT